MRIETPCNTCSGTGIVRRPRRIKVRIPPGVVTGQRVRFRQRGGPGYNGGPPGDLYVTVEVRPDARFGRRGKDLTVTVPVSFPDATLGATITAPTIEGSVSLKVPAGTRSGKTFRVRGRGAAGGDLLVTVDVEVPQKLTDEARRLVEQLRDELNGGQG